jgi:type II secretory pathway component PulF
MKFAYHGYDRAGKNVAETIEANSLSEASDSLRKQGVFVTNIHSEEHGPSTARAAGRGKTARLRNTAMLVRQLSVLVSTGTPMVEAVMSLERQTPAGSWRNVLIDVRERIERGGQLSAAMAHHPAYFDAVARSLVAAGESSGKLDDMLRRLSTLVRQQLKIRSSVSGAMVYPALLCTVCLGVLATMMFFVLPRFEGLFANLGAPLPPSTKVVMDLSQFLRSYWWAVLGATIPTVIAVKMWMARPTGRLWVHSLLIRLPVFGKVFRAFATARLARILGVLVESKVPLLEAMQLARETTGNLCYERLVDEAGKRVERGENFSATLQGSTLVNPSFVEAVRSGESAGRLGTVLLSLADFLDEDNEIILRSLSSIIEPLILIVLGTLVGFVAVSMFMPLFDLATATNAGGH